MASNPHPKCQCTMAQSLVGDGCRYCQAQEYIDRLHEQIEDEAAPAAPAVQEEPVAYISHTSEGDILGWERQFDAPSHTPLYLTPHPADQQPAPTRRFTKETHDENYQQ